MTTVWVVKRYFTSYTYNPRALEGRRGKEVQSGWLQSKTPNPGNFFSHQVLHTFFFKYKLRGHLLLFQFLEVAINRDSGYKGE